jgi:very-short-patch-repair endonuclease
VAIKDAEKQAFLEKKGYYILRFTENEVVKNLDKVTDIVLYTIEILSNDLE